MYCYKCGTSLPADAVFCSKCGTKTPGLNDSATVGDNPKKGKFKRIKPFGRIAIAIYCAITIAVVSVVVAPKGLPNKDNFTSFMPQKDDVSIYGLKMQISDGDWAASPQGFIATNCQEAADFVSTSAKGTKAGGLSYEESAASDSYFLWNEFINFKSEADANSVIDTIYQGATTGECDSLAGIYKYTGGNDLKKKYGVDVPGAYIVCDYEPYGNTPSYGKDIMVIVRRSTMLEYIMIHHPDSANLGDESDSKLIALSMKKFLG